METKVIWVSLPEVQKVLWQNWAQPCSIEISATLNCKWHRQARFKGLSPGEALPTEALESNYFITLGIWILPEENDFRCIFISTKRMLSCSKLHVKLPRPIITHIFKCPFKSRQSKMRIPIAGYEVVESLFPKVDAAHQLIKYWLKTFGII